MYMDVLPKCFANVVNEQGQMTIPIMSMRVGVIDLLEHWQDIEGMYRRI